VLSFQHPIDALQPRNAGRLGVRNPKADASWALAISGPAQGDGRKHAQSCSRNCPRHSDITQSDDKGDAGKYIQSTHRTSPERDAASLSAMIPFSRILQGGAEFCGRWVNVCPSRPVSDRRSDGMTCHRLPRNTYDRAAHVTMYRSAATGGKTCPQKIAFAQPGNRLPRSGLF